MTDRQELARALAMCDDYDGCFERVDEWEATPEDERRDVEYPASDYEDCQWWLRRADVILAAGWRKPRTITTLDELDELPKHSTIITQYECVIQLGESTGRGWRVGFVPGVGPMRSVDDPDLPALVLWETR